MSSIKECGAQEEWRCVRVSCGWPFGWKHSESPYGASRTDQPAISGVLPMLPSVPKAVKQRGATGGDSLIADDRRFYAPVSKPRPVPCK